MEAKLSGGKTAPRLLSDILSYDPANQRPGFNTLVDIPKFNNEEKKWLVDPTPSKNNCCHEWALDENHTILPSPRPELAHHATYWMTAHCTACRGQLNVTLKFEESSSSCPSSDAPLHHFIQLEFVPQSFATEESLSELPDLRDVQYFVCTSPDCKANLQVVFRPSHLIPEWVDLLTNPERIRARAEPVIVDDPERFEGVRVPTGADVLSNLRQYLLNGLPDSNPSKKPNEEPDGKPRIIKAGNKRWLLSLGEPCAEILERLGFKRSDGDWACPIPGKPTQPPSIESLHNRLNHVEKEIQILLSERPRDERKGLEFRTESANVALRNLLGTSKYRTRPGWQSTSAAVEHPFYAGLGVVGDFHDALIVFAYDRQVAIDPDNLPYYLECLQGICDGREGPEDLQTKVLLEQTTDKISSRDVRAAYKKLGVANHLDDETILGTFQARLADAPSFQEEELREALKIVGTSRKSKRLREAASMEIKTYEQALSFLDATADFADDAVITMFTTKVHDSPSDEPRAREAVRLVAEHRNSTALKAWLSTGELGEVEMDVGHAYNRLEISDRTVDDESVLVAFNIYASETPSQLDDLKKALKAIATSRNSKLLLNELGMTASSEQYSPAEWPVGLENIGNTCYLNSLLQSYFSVKPLRELVLNFDHYRMLIDAQSLAMKQVGSRQVSRQEVERAQKFVSELRGLFGSMITAPNSEVKPEQELARLTLMSSTTEEQVRRRSTLRGPRPSLGEINGHAILGPLLPPSDEEVHSDIVMIDRPVADVPTLNGEPTADDSSSVTLIDISIPAQEDVEMNGLEDMKSLQQNILDDKENLPPTKEDSARPRTPDGDLVALSDASPSRANRQVRTLSPVREGENNDENEAMKPIVPHPNRPPPVPPRPDQQAKVSIQEQLEIGAQQDVTEVIGNVLFQLQCAIKPEQFDSNGEQIDMVKRLFYGKLKSITTDQAGATRSNEAFCSDIKVNVFSDPPPADIYAALDGAFDEQDVEVGGAVEPQYTTFSLLPPVLQIHINRTDFDREKQANVKSNHLFEIPETLYMDRYTDLVDAELVSRRTQKWAWKKELSSLEAKRKLSGDDVPEKLKTLRDLLMNINLPADNDPINVPPQVLEAIEREEMRLREEAKVNASRAKDLRTNIETQFIDQKNVCYRLHSVFIHRGGASSGHYWIYIYDFERKLWRKYNDGYVTKANESEIFGREALATPPTPYFLTYIRDGFQSQLIDCVCRDPIEVISEPVEDLVMEDVMPSVEFEHSEAITQIPKVGEQKGEYVPITKWGDWDASESGQMANWLNDL